MIPGLAHQEALAQNLLSQAHHLFPPSLARGVVHVANGKQGRLEVKLRQSPNLKGWDHNVFLSLLSHIFGVWYSWFWSEGPKNHLNLTILVPDFDARGFE